MSWWHFFFRNPFYNYSHSHTHTNIAQHNEDQITNTRIFYSSNSLIKWIEENSKHSFHGDQTKISKNSNFIVIDILNQPICKYPFSKDCQKIDKKICFKILKKFKNVFQIPIPALDLHQTLENYLSQFSNDKFLIGDNHHMFGDIRKRKDGKLILIGLGLILLFQVNFEIHYLKDVYKFTGNGTTEIIHKIKLK